MEAFMSMITAFGCSYVIRNWGACAGGIVAISQNTSLFSLLGTTFGGNGHTNFGLPDLRARSPVGMGYSSGMVEWRLGEKGGQQHVTLTTAELPSHLHDVSIIGRTVESTGQLEVSTEPANVQNPNGAYLGATTGLTRPYTATMSNPAGVMKAVFVGSQEVRVEGTTLFTGNGSPVPTQSPAQAVNFQICMMGIYPSHAT